MIDAKKSQVIATLPVADRESFGVNYSPRAPGQAFLMNRFKQEIAVIDTEKMDLVDQIDVKRFDDVGKYPWSVTIPNGQNYCH